jgi:hypothetical protein
MLVLSNRGGVRAISPNAGCKCGFLQLLSTFFLRNKKMPNWTHLLIILSGDGAKAVADMFENPDVADEWFRQKYNSKRCYDLGFNDEHLDPDRIVISCSTAWSAPLPLIHEVSEHYPGLTIEVDGLDPMGDTRERWIFKGGKGTLMDYSVGVRGEFDELAYVRDGKQLLKFPEWIPFDDDPEFAESPKQSVENDSSDTTEAESNESSKVDGGLDNEFIDSLPN